MGEAQKRLKRLTWKSWRRLISLYRWCAYYSRVLPLPKELKYDDYDISGGSTWYDFWPADQEQVKVEAIWVIDFVGPSQLSDAVSKMRKVGWREGLVSDTDPKEWLGSAREISSASWRNLGFVTRNQTNNYGTFHTEIVDFPSCFKSASFCVVTVSPSLSAIGCFWLQEEESDAFNKISRLHLFSHMVPHLNGTISSHSPRSQKEKRIKRKRHFWRNQASRFLRDKFSTYASTYRPELVTSIEAVSLSKPLNKEAQNFFFRREKDWENDAYGLRWTSLGDDVPHHSVLQISSDALHDVDLKMYGGKNIRALLHKLSRSLEANWTLEALNNHLQIFEIQLTDRRDKQFKPLTSRKSRRDLIKSGDIRMMAEIGFIATELSNEDLVWARRGAIELTQTSFDGSEQLSRTKAVSNRIKERAQRAVRHHLNITTMSRSLNESFATFEMARMARGALATTIVSAMIALLALFSSLDFYSANNTAFLWDILSSNLEK